MKIRKGFVSNSSSSSFIVIGDSIEKDLSHLKDIFAERYLIVLGENGQAEFGWQEEEYNDMWSRINFAYLQTQYVDVKVGERWLNMLEELIHEYFGEWEIDWQLADYGEHKNKTKYGNKSIWGYIDHQSSASEGVNTKMFKDKETLRLFLFSNGSYIKCDNDNH